MCGACPCPSFFGTCAKFSMSVYFQKSIKFFGLNIRYLVFLLYSAENSSNDLQIIAIWFYLCFTLLFWNWGCMCVLFQNVSYWWNWLDSFRVCSQMFVVYGVMKTFDCIDWFWQISRTALDPQRDCVMVKSEDIIWNKYKPQPIIQWTQRNVLLYKMVWTPENGNDKNCLNSVTIIICNIFVIPTLLCLGPRLSKSSSQVQPSLKYVKPRTQPADRVKMDEV